MFRALKVPACELRLEPTLFCGQAFTWLKRPNFTNRFIGMVNRHLVVELKEEANNVEYRVVATVGDQENDDVENDIRKYFNLDYSMTLTDLHEHFSKCDPNVYARLYPYFPGLRVIRQDPLECLISFICSSNNNVSRITKMIYSLCENYGTYVGDLNLTEDDDKQSEVQSVKFYAFPTLDQLSRATEKELRDLGFGYRAKYVTKTVAALKTKGNTYLTDLRDNKQGKTSHEIIDDLTCFNGVGCKVASCVSLYSLDCFDLVPTDVHILRVARMHYTSLLENQKEDKKNKSDSKQLLESATGSMNTQKMKNLMKMFVTIFGVHAGWAQMILYGSQTQSFKKQLPKALVTELFGEEKTPEKKKSTPKKRKSKKQASENEDEDTSEEEYTPSKVAKVEEPLDVILTSRVTRSRTRKLIEVANGKYSL